MDKYQVVKDAYMMNRSGFGKLTNVFCKQCQTDILLYQKDGPGWLKRMYVDRILAPAELVNKYKNAKNIDDIYPLVCPKCKTVLALPMEYIKPQKNENRLALKCVAVRRDINRSGNYPVKRRKSK